MTNKNDNNEVINKPNRRRASIEILSHIGGNTMKTDAMK